jgi:hypothetical protein
MDDREPRRLLYNRDKSTIQGEARKQMDHSTS